jgi:ABC-type amino acid transport substrate-binding protein
MKCHRTGRRLGKVGAALTFVTAVTGVTLAAPLAATASSSSSAKSFDLVTPGTLTVADFGTELPDVGINANKISGLDGVFLNAFAKKYGLKVKLFTTSFPSTILAVQQNKADLAVNFYWSPARGQTVKFGTPYNADYTVVIVNKKAIPKYTGPSSLAGKKIGSIVGTVYQPVVQAAFPASDVTVYTGIPEAGSALLNGQIDAMVDSSSTFDAPPLAGSKDIAEFPGKVGQYGITAADASFPDSNIVGCKNNSLNTALNAELKSLEKSGQWNKALKQYGAPTPYKTYATPTGGCNAS